MRFFIPLWIAEALFAALFIVTGYPKSTKKAFWFKMIACAIYTANGLYAYSLGEKTYGRIILVGLACGWIGDLFLALDPFTRDRLKQKQSLILTAIGGLFFLLGHAAYMAAFLRQILRQENAFRVLPLAVSFLSVLLCILLVFRLCKVSAGKFTAAVVVYIAGLSGMCALAISAALLVARGSVVQQTILIAAPLLFAFSDVTLALRCADKDRFESLVMRTVCLSAYFLAQMLLGLSILQG